MTYNIVNYTKISDKLLQNTNLKLSSRVIYARLAYRMNLSIANNDDYFDKRGHFYYVVYKIKDLMHDCGLGRTAVINSLKELVNHGLVIKHRLIHLVRLELPKFQVETPTNHKSKLVKRTKTFKTKTNNNTKVNTKTHKSLKFKPINKNFAWMDSAKTLGLTLDTIDKIAKFSDTYSKSAYKITKLIIEARDVVANHNHVSKQVRGFETNRNIKFQLGNKLYKLFSYITNPKYAKAKLNNFAGWFVKSLKSFFKNAFGLIKDKPTVEPKQKSIKHNKNYKHDMNLIHDYENEDNHLTPTDPKVVAKIRKQLKAIM